jgi:hypothetical protein
MNKGESTNFTSTDNDSMPDLADISDEDDNLDSRPEFAFTLGDENDPKSIREAMESPEADKWKKAMEVEINQLDNLHTWELVDSPHDANITNSSFTFHQKHNQKGGIASYKACFVRKGYSQVYGIDYYETFAPSVRMSSLQIVLTYAAKENWEIHQVDIKGAYLNANLPETVYIKPPPNYLKPGDEGKVCHLLKGLYGIKQPS